MTPPTLLQMAEACETAADAERIAASDLGVEELPLAGALRSAAALLRTLATSDVEGVAGELDRVIRFLEHPPPSCAPNSLATLRTASLLLRASAAREAEAVTSERKACMRAIDRIDLQDRIPNAYLAGIREGILLAMECIRARGETAPAGRRGTCPGRGLLHERGATDCPACSGSGAQKAKGE